MNISMSIYGSVLEARCWGLDPSTGRKWLDRTGDVIRRHLDDFALPEDPDWECTGVQIKMDARVSVMNDDKGVELDRFLLEDIDGQSQVAPCPIPTIQFHLFHTSWQKGGADYRYKNVPEYRRDLLSFSGVGIGTDGGLGVVTSIQLGDDEQYPEDVGGREQDWDYWVD